MDREERYSRYSTGMSQKQKIIFYVVLCVFLSAQTVLPLLSEKINTILLTDNTKLLTDMIAKFATINIGNTTREYLYYNPKQKNYSNTTMKQNITIL